MPSTSERPVRVKTTTNRSRASRAGDHALGYYTLDPNHDLVPATLEEWGEMMEDTEGRRVGRTEVDVKGKPVIVSTVFLGIDHGFGKSPLFFETMTFGDPYDQHLVARYATWDQAARGHSVCVTRLTHGYSPGEE